MSSDLSLHALCRFGLGPRPGEATALDDPRAWVLAQLEETHGAQLDAKGLLGPRALAELLARQRRARQEKDEVALEDTRREMREVATREASTVLAARTYSETPFLERLVAFWSNHLCISTAGKSTIEPLAGWYERSVIRPNVLRRYEDMVLDSARHPAMLLYLDNATSIGPNSRAARRASRRGRDRGLNENYARELLELHTLGVDGGYDQLDVEQLARMLTGWTSEGLGPHSEQESLGFRFREELHEPGEKRLLGKTYGEDGEDEARRAIADLCRHPSTARFLASKLARHFVADDPPEVAVIILERAYRDSDGDLRELARALANLDAAWDLETKKFRSPQDWLVAVMRIDPPDEVPDSALKTLRKLRHPLWGPPAPKGYDDRLGDWADPDSLMNRAELGRRLAKQLKRDGLRAGELLDLLPSGPRADLNGVLEGAVAARDALALLIGGPAFQWR